MEVIIEGEMKHSILSSLSLLVASTLLRLAEQMTIRKEILPIKVELLKYKYENTIISPLHTGPPGVG